MGFSDPLLLPPSFIHSFRGLPASLMNSDRLKEESLASGYLVSRLILFLSFSYPRRYILIYYKLLFKLFFYYIYF